MLRTLSKVARSSMGSSSKMMSTSTVDLTGKFQVHNTDMPSETAEVTKEELYHAYVHTNLTISLFHYHHQANHPTIRS
jgi:hypothetical protein